MNISLYSVAVIMRYPQGLAVTGVALSPEWKVSDPPDPYALRLESQAEVRDTAVHPVAKCSEVLRSADL